MSKTTIQEHLVILSHTELGNVVKRLKEDSSVASQITSIHLYEKEEEEEDDDDEDEKPKISAEDYANLVFIFEAVQRQGSLQSFRWIVPHRRGLRPPSIWETLGKAASTLKELDLNFFIHETKDIRLILDCSASHGCGAPFVEKLLLSTPKLKHLDLDLPMCDLESCRIQGIKWDYRFPDLEHLSLSVYEGNPTLISKFLEQHPTITSLRLEVDFDGDISLEIPDAVLPNIRVFQSSNLFHHQYISYMMSPSARRPITHLNIDSYSHGKAPPIENLGRTLKHLEIDVSITSWRYRSWVKLGQDAGEEDGEEEDDDSDAEEDEKRERKEADDMHDRMKHLLLSLTELEELCLNLPSGNTYRGGCNPAPMDFEDLNVLIRCLPPVTKIRAIHLKDESGKELPEEYINNFPDIPNTIEYLCWDVGEQRFLYKLQNADGKTKAIRCDPIPIPDMKGKSWTDDSILKS